MCIGWEHWKKKYLTGFVERPRLNLVVGWKWFFFFRQPSINVHPPKLQLGNANCKLIQGGCIAQPSKQTDRASHIQTQLKMIYDDLVAIQLAWVWITAETSLFQTRNTLDPHVMVTGLVPQRRLPITCRSGSVHTLVPFILYR